jgi:hypothetical protein
MFKKILRRLTAARTAARPMAYRYRFETSESFLNMQQELKK